VLKSAWSLGSIELRDKEGNLKPQHLSYLQHRTTYRNTNYRKQYVRK